MLKPDIFLTSVLDINLDILKKIKVKAIILDVDNTIRQHKKIEIYDGVLNWVDHMRRSGVAIVIASNNFKKRVEPVAKMLKLPYVSLSFKPFPLGLKKAAKKIGIQKNNIAVVGDQFFTDIIGGKCQGFKTILLKPLKKESGIFWGLRRALERLILRNIF